MRYLPTVVVLCVIGSVCGCGKSGPEQTQALEATGPLTVEEWKALPIETKYDETTFERLKKNDEKLQTEQGWDKFMREVVVPERKKDIPATPTEQI